MLCLTHSTRALDFSRVTLNFLTTRYADPARLANPPALHTLPSEHNPDYTGAVTLWDWDGQPGSKPSLRHFIPKPYKAQHAAIWRERLVICGTAFLELYPLAGPFDRPAKVFSHPWFAGGHTVFVDPQTDNLVVSCSAPDAVLIFGPDGVLCHAWRVPTDLYGQNYLLAPNDDLRAHYVPNDLQIAHLNCASPCERGFLCSLLIPGAIGLFDRRGGYQELTRGWIGCHGARAAPGGFTFADSCTGLACHMDWEGRMLARFATESAWLHDAVKLDQRHWLCAPSDRNRFELWDAAENRLCWDLDCSQFGETTQFIGGVPL